MDLTFVALFPWCPIGDLEVLDVSKNKITGKIPFQLGDLIASVHLSQNERM